MEEFDEIIIFDDSGSPNEKAVSSKKAERTGYMLFLIIALICTVTMAVSNIAIVGTCLVGTMRKSVIIIWTVVFITAMIARIIFSILYMRNRRRSLESNAFMWKRARQSFAYVLTLVVDVFFFLLCAYLFYAISSVFNTSTVRLLLCIGTTIAHLATAVSIHAFALSS